MKTNETSNICCECGGHCKPSKALRNTLVSFTDFGNDAGKRGTTQSRVGAAQLVDCLKCEKCGHSFVPQETSTREQAVAWWNMLLTTPQRKLMTKYEVVGHGVRRPNDLTPREIEKIWQAEVNGECNQCGQTVQNCECHISNEDKHKGLYAMSKALPQLMRDMKPNQKQFHRFDESLFKTYINKFSQEHKAQMLQILIDDCGRGSTATQESGKFV